MAFQARGPLVRALVTEEEPVSRLLAQRMLEALGCHVRAVAGADALAWALGTEPVDLLVVDADALAGRALPVAVGEARPYVVAVADDVDGTPTPGADLVLGRPLAPARLRGVVAGLTRSEPAPIEAEHLAEMTGSDPEMARELARDYLELALPTHGEAREAYAAGDHQALYLVTHRLAGCLGAVGARRGALLARHVSHAARTGDADVLPGAWGAFTRELPRVEHALRALATLPARPARAGTEGAWDAMPFEDGA